jgi:hypothetical protein
MKMKKTLLVILIIHFVRLNAQNGFYFRPALEKTISYHKNQFALTLYNDDGLPITIQSRSLIPIKGFPIGFYIGYKFKKIAVETGILGCDPISGATLSGFHYDSTQNLYNSYYGKYYSGVAFTKVPIRVNYNLFKKDSLNKSKYSLSLDLNLGLDLLFAPSGNQNQAITTEDFSFYSKSGQVTNINTATYSAYNHFSYMSTIGLTFKFNKKKTNILNFTFLYSRGIDALSEERMIISQTNATTITHSEYSNGGGFYLSVSREFYLNNFLNRRKRKTTEKYERFKKSQ